MIKGISIHALLAESDCMYFCPGGQSRTFLSTLSLRRATSHIAACKRSMVISIHALLAESDARIRRDGTRTYDISIHALLAESDRLAYRISPAICHFYPRSPCGERLNVPETPNYGKEISIHALLAESDLSGSTKPSARRISIHALLAESDK